jgi:protein-S-isoprenylcysteine O-methyltransferase Ste14
MSTECLKTIRRGKLYDLLIAAPLIGWYLFCAAYLLPSVVQKFALIKLFVQTDVSVLPTSLALSAAARVCTLVFFAVLIVMFAIRRVPLQTAPGWYPRCNAVAGTFLGVGLVLLPPQEISPALYLVSLVLIISGTVFAIWTGLALGRSISIVPQARRLVTWGPYAFVRHPLYLGETVALVGIALQFLSAWAFLLVVAQFAFQLRRMEIEERLLLKVFPEYGDYVARTARLVPGLY